MLLKRCMAGAGFAVMLLAFLLFRYVGGFLPERNYLFGRYWPYMAGYAAALWLNVGVSIYLAARHLGMKETGRKLRHVDPIRGGDNVFAEEMRAKVERQNGTRY